MERLQLKMLAIRAPTSPVSSYLGSYMRDGRSDPLSFARSLSSRVRVARGLETRPQLGASRLASYVEGTQLRGNCQIERELARKEEEETLHVLYTKHLPGSG